jgi:hypothetical protein
MGFETLKSTTAATIIIKFAPDWKMGINLGFWDRYTVSITTGTGTSFGGNTKPGYRRSKWCLQGNSDASIYTLVPIAIKHGIVPFT